MNTVLTTKKKIHSTNCRSNQPVWAELCPLTHVLYEPRNGDNIENEYPEQNKDARGSEGDVDPMDIHSGVGVVAVAWIAKSVFIHSEYTLSVTAVKPDIKEYGAFCSQSGS